MSTNACSIISVLDQHEAKINSPVLGLRGSIVGKPSEVMMTMTTSTANHTPPGTPQQQRTHQSLPQPGRCRPHQNPMLGAIATKVLTTRRFYVNLLPRSHPTTQTTPSSTPLSTTMKDTRNQANAPPPHPILPFYKKGMTSSRNSTTSILKSEHSAMNTFTHAPTTLRTPRATTSPTSTTTTNDKRMTQTSLVTDSGNSKNSTTSSFSS